MFYKYILKGVTVTTIHNFDDVRDIKTNAKRKFDFEHEGAANSFYALWIKTYPGIPILVEAVST